MAYAAAIIFILSFTLFLSRQADLGKVIACNIEAHSLVFH